MLESACEIIRRIEEEWLREAKTELVGSSVQESLKIFTELVFVEPGHFILELLQNAEDARMELKKKGGFFSVKLFKDKAEIRHNGKPFDHNDIRSLCKIGSSKKPREGYKGYIGIGWKSVFKVSDEVYVHSGNYAFKFDKRYWEENAEYLKNNYGVKPSSVPWQVVPICVKPTEHIPDDQTLIVIQFNDPRHYDDVSSFLENLKPYMFLFLEYITRIEIEDDVKKVKRVIEWSVTSKEEFDNVSVERVFLTFNNKVERLLIFRKCVKVPDYVKRDKLTQTAKRDDVDAREIALVFALDEYGDLKPIEEAAFWGVYSFMPLLEASTGLKFLIQADLIVHPGRRSVNSEALWNKWLTEQVAELLKSVTRYLSERFGTTYLSVFEYKDIGGAFYERLIKPSVIRVIEEELKDPVIPCIKGHRIPLSKAVIFNEKVRSFIEEGLIDEEDLKNIYGEDGLHLIDPGVKLRSVDRGKVKWLELKDLMTKSFIEAKDKDKCLNLLAKVYRKIEDLTSLPEDRRYVLTRSLRIVKASNAYISELPREIIELSKQYPEVKKFLEEQEYVHDFLVNKLDKDLLQRIGVKVLSFREVAEKIFLPKIKAEARPPDKEELRAISLILKQAQINITSDIWVIARGGVIAKSSEVYYPLKHFKPFELYESLGIRFLDLDAYGARDEEEWKSFFSSTNIKGLYCYHRYYYSYIHWDYQDLVNRIVKVLKESTDKDKLIAYTRALKRLFDSCMWSQTYCDAVNVVTNKGVLKSNTVYLHSRYEPRDDWMKWENFYEIGPFITSEYMEERDDPRSWKSFLVKVLCVREEGTQEHVKEFAELYAKHKLKERGFEIIGECGEGYDYEVRYGDKSILIEVKGRSLSHESIVLTMKETKKAIECGENYWLIVVLDIPNNPQCYVLKNLSNILSNAINIQPGIPLSTVKERGERWD